MDKERDEISASVEFLLSETELYLKARTNLLNHGDPNIRFCLLTVPNPDVHEFGYPVHLFYGAGYGDMLPKNREEIIEAIDAVQLKPGDITISAYSLNGPERPTCISVSKVVEFFGDGVTPSKLVHMWPREYFNKAIDPWELRGRKAKIKDKREAS